MVKKQIAASTDTADCKDQSQGRLHLHILPFCQGDLGALKQNQSLKGLHPCVPPGPTQGVTPGSHCRAQEMNFSSALGSGCAVMCGFVPWVPDWFPGGLSGNEISGSLEMIPDQSRAPLLLTQVLSWLSSVRVLPFAPCSLSLEQQLLLAVPSRAAAGLSCPEEL